MKNLWTKFKAWMVMSPAEKYLSKSTDHADLEYRMKTLRHGPSGMDHIRRHSTYYL